MPSIKHAAGEFLANRRIAVTGVSRKPENHGSNVVYKRLPERGYESSRSTPTPTGSRAIAPTTACARSPAAWMRS